MKIPLARVPVRVYGTRMTTKQVNRWLKVNLPIFARVVEARINQVIIGADASVDLSKYSDQIKSGLGVKEVWAYGCSNYLTLNW